MADGRRIWISLHSPPMTTKIRARRISGYLKLKYINFLSLASRKSIHSAQIYTVANMRSGHNLKDVHHQLHLGFHGLGFISVCSCRNQSYTLKIF